MAILKEESPMKYWNTRKILISTLMLFTILSAIGWRQDNVDDFLSSNQSILDSHFRLTTVSNDGTLVINQTVLAPAVIALSWMFILFIWVNSWPTKVKISVMATMMVVASLFLTGSFDHVVARWMVNVLTFPPMIWVPFGILFVMFYLIFEEEQVPVQYLLWAVPVALLLGDLAHGWFGHVTNTGLMALLSGLLYASSFVCACFCGLLLTLGVLLGKALIFIIGTVLVKVISWLLVALAWIALVVLAVVAIIVLGGLFAGMTPREHFERIRRSSFEGL